MMSEAFRWLMARWLNLQVREVGHLSLELAWQEEALKNIIADSKAKYDLILLETTFAQEANAVLSHRFNAPMVEIMPTSNFHWSYYVHGIPYDPSYIGE